MLNFNGVIYPQNEKIFTAQNRNFRYGDGLFETIRVFNGKIPLFEWHHERLLAGMQALKMKIPTLWYSDFLLDEVKKIITAYHKLHQIAPNYSVRLAVFRADGGLYTPLSHDLSFCIEVSPLAENYFIWQPLGLHCGIFEDILLAPSPISAFKTSNALPYVLAALYRHEQQIKKEKQPIDDCFLLNTHKNICESIAANIFAITHDNQLVTPPLLEGCISGVMRKLVLIMANNMDMECKEQTIQLSDLQHFKEIFLTNSQQGIRWVKSCQHESKTLYESNNPPKIAYKFLTRANKFLSLQ
jgi:branched-subunit amino acid aminotransferase/4-amino-4-deoxychorismate lyase